MEAKDWIALVALFVSALLGAIRLRDGFRERRAEITKQLLGDKEAVCAAAVKLLDGEPLPTRGKERKQLLATLMQACVLEGSDRARALLFRVVDKSRGKDREDIEKALELIEDAVKEMKRFEFTKKELDGEDIVRHLNGLQKVLNHPLTQWSAPTADSC
jgi:type IV secretory pathway VirD2 relaxase